MTPSHGHCDVEWIKIDILKAASYVKARLITGASSTKIEFEHKNKLESDSEIYSTMFQDNNTVNESEIIQRFKQSPTAEVRLTEQTDDPYVVPPPPDEPEEFLSAAEVAAIPESDRVDYRPHLCDKN